MCVCVCVCVCSLVPRLLIAASDFKFEAVIKSLGARLVCEYVRLRVPQIKAHLNDSFLTVIRSAEKLLPMGCGFYYAPPPLQCGCD